MSDIEELNELLWDAEEIGVYTNSSCGEDSGILVATNRRVFFLSKEFSNYMKITNLIYINKIKGLDYGKGPYSGWIEIGIKRRRKNLRFNNIDNDSVIEIFDYIKGRIGQINTIITLNQK